MKWVAVEKDPNFKLARSMVEVADWARGDSLSAAFIGKVGVPTDKAFHVMCSAVKSSPD